MEERGAEKGGVFGWVRDVGIKEGRRRVGGRRLDERGGSRGGLRGGRREEGAPREGRALGGGIIEEMHKTGQGGDGICHGVRGGSEVLCGWGGRGGFRAGSEGAADGA